MQGPDWNSTAIFLAWDDWGGFYDHVTPPTVDGQGYGLRVPGAGDQPLRAAKGYIDHQTLSFDAYLKFIEDDFLGGQRLDPATDGRPDPRPTVRENVSILGDLRNDFDFNQTAAQAADPRSTTAGSSTRRVRRPETSRRAGPALLVRSGVGCSACGGGRRARPSRAACRRSRARERHESLRAERRETRRGAAARAPPDTFLPLTSAEPPPAKSPAANVADIHKIKHVVIIMQENRSFDSYFGTYPGADGYPRDAHGNITVCVPDPTAGACQRPYHDPAITNAGGPHQHADAVADVDGGKMDGFISSVEAGGSFDTDKATCLAKGQQPVCVDVMGYHDQREIPNYWSYAKSFVLQDHMFEPSTRGA